PVYDRVIRDKTGSAESDSETPSADTKLAEPLEPTENETLPEEKKKSGNGKKIALVIVAVLAALLIGAGAFFLVSGITPASLFSSSSSGTSAQTTASSGSSYSESTDYEETTSRTTTQTTTEPDGTYYRVSVGRNNRLSLRALPDEDSTKLDRIDNGTGLYITELRGNWGRTTYDGQSGWVCISKDGDTYCVKD
ncbi:MAG: SH3 domain-containing protein, partial [Clostridia bacterium]|nr:SH3 domain-containing protein [Clostridia bacterium]